MTETEPDMANLFLQLGLPADEKSIAGFIRTHRLAPGVRIAEAEFWNAAQRQFICEKLRIDGPWSLVVDALNEALHEESTDAQH